MSAPLTCQSRAGKHLGVFPRPERDLGWVFLPFPCKKNSPFSSICSCPDLVEATTFAAISLTLREHSWSLARFLLLFSAFTCNEHRNGCGCPPQPPPWSSREPQAEAKSFWHENLAVERMDGWMDRWEGLSSVIPSWPDKVIPAKPFSPRAPNQLCSHFSQALREDTALVLQLCS